MEKEQIRLLSQFETAFIPLLEKEFGENLVSVTLYGSAVKGHFTSGESDLNALIVLKNADPQAVSALGRSASRIMKKNRINPLLLTEEEFLGSADVFPMEYLDIRESRRVMHGVDLTERLDITQGNLRHQAEEQLRGSVASLRRALLETRGKERPMKRFLDAWFGSQNALFRGLLRLKQHDPIPHDPIEAIKTLEEAYSFNSAPLQAAVRLRSGEKLSATQTAMDILGSLVELEGRVDAMGGKDG